MANDDLLQQLKQNLASFEGAGLTEDAEAIRARIAEVEGETVEDEEGYESWSNEELSDELETRGLAKSGNKAELIERLEDDDANDDAEGTG